MPLTSIRAFVILGLLTPSIALAQDAVALRRTDAISNEALLAWKAQYPANRVSVIQFALNGTPLPNLYEMAIRRDGALMLSVRALVELADGSVYNDSEESLGFYLSKPSDTIDVFKRKNSIAYQGSEYPYAADDWATIDGIEYIAYPLLSTFLPFKAEFREVEGTVEIVTTSPWPREQRIQRELQWARLANATDPENINSLPLLLAYELSGAPQADIALSWRKASSGQAVSGYSANMVSEALYMTNVISFSGSFEQGLSAIRMHTGRTDPGGSVFGISGLYQFQAGDVIGLSLPGIGGLASGRGIVLRAAPLDQDQGFDQTYISGDAPAGWDIELYTNGSLLTFGRVGVDGRYLFKDVPLRYGANEFKVVFYGPNGQTREQNFLKTVGGNMLRPDELNMYGYLAQPGTQLFNVDSSGRTEDAESNDLVGSLKLDYGVSADLTLSSFIARSQYLVNDANLNTTTKRTTGYAGIEARPSLKLADIEAGLVRQIDGGSGAYTRISIPIGSNSLTTSINLFGQRFYSAGNQYGSDWIRRRIRVRSSFPINIGEGGGFVGISGENIDLHTNASATLASLSYGHRLGTTYLNHNIDAERYKNSLLQSSSYQARYRGLTSTRFSDVGMRSELNYILSGSNAGFESLGVNAYWTHSRGAFINGSYFYTPGGASALEVSVSKQFKGVSLSLGVTRSGASRYSLNAGVNFSLGYAPTIGANFSSEQRTSYSQAKIRIFNDKNENSAFDENVDEAISNAEVFLNDTKVKDVSDASGHIYIDKLGTNEIQHIRVSSEELSDKFLVSKTPSLSISARQGQLHYLPFVLTDMGEINGVIEYRIDGGELLPLANARLQILSQAGVVLQETTSLSDGYYSFDKIFAGHWTIRLHPKQIDSLKALSMLPKNVQLTKQQNIMSGVNLLIENKAIR